MNNLSHLEIFASITTWRNVETHSLAQMSATVNASEQVGPVEMAYDI